MATAQPLSAKEIAAQFDTTPRTVRKFFRAEVESVGRGNRYSYTPAEVKKLQTKFNKWVASLEATDAE